MISQKQDTLFVSITSQSIDGFSKSFHCYKIIVTYPTIP